MTNQNLIGSISEVKMSFLGTLPLGTAKIIFFFPGSIWYFVLKECDPQYDTEITKQHGLTKIIFPQKAFANH